MKKVILYSFLYFSCLSIPSIIVAQKKIPVGFSEFRYSPETCSERSSINIYNYIVNAFHDAQRFKVLDREYEDIIHSEIERQKDGRRFINSESVVEQGRMLGAKWMVAAQIIAAQAIRSENSEGYDSYISFFLRIFDVETGEIVAAEAITPSGRETIGMDAVLGTFMPKAGDIVTKPGAEETAMAIGLEKIRPHIATFIRENFPIELSFYKVENDGKKDKVILLGNKRMGLEVGQIFDVRKLEIITIDNKKNRREIPIGKLKLERFEGAFIRFDIYEDEGGVIDNFKNNKDELLIRELTNVSSDPVDEFLKLKFLKNKKKKKKNDENDSEG